MNKEQALALTEHIRAETPRIQATFDESQARDGRGYQVRLHLAQREFSVNDLGEWESIKLAWQWFLLPEEEILVPPPPGRKPPTKPRHLVDGVAMYISRQKNGYWIGFYTRDKKQRKKYFGKQDPRDRYPLVEEALNGSA